jgi:hypothetical protein
MGQMRNTYRILVRKPKGKRPRERARRRCKNNIKTDLREVRWDGVDWIHLSQDRDEWWVAVKTVMNLREFLD